MAREVRRGSFSVGPDQASDPANPISRASSFIVDDESGPGLGASALEVWPASVFPIPIPDCDKWEALPFDSPIRGPSGQEGQVLLSGTICAASLFHSNDELDWHLWLSLDPALRAEMTDIVHEFSEHKGNVLPDNDYPANCPGSHGKFHGVFSELMVLDAYGPAPGGLKLFSADVRTLFELGGDAWPSTGGQWATFLRGRVAHLQGNFVWDGGHSGWWEIHPLDSIAYLRAGQPPRGTISWRVGAFSNSDLHNINGCGGGTYLATSRETVWCLDLPPGATNGNRTRVEVEEHVFRHGREEGAISGSGLAYRQPETRYRNYRATYDVEPGPGLRDLAEFPVDPRDGTRKLRIGIVTDAPDEFGSMLGLDVTMTVQ